MMIAVQCQADDMTIGEGATGECDDILRISKPGSHPAVVGACAAMVFAEAISSVPAMRRRALRGAGGFDWSMDAMAAACGIIFTGAVTRSFVALGPCLEFSRHRPGEGGRQCQDDRKSAH